MEKVKIERINDANFYEITKLKVGKEQKNFVASNTYSLAHAYLAQNNGIPVFPFGIFVEEKPIGFLMIGYNIFPDKQNEDANCDWFLKDSYVLWRLMIDKKYQSKGYAKSAVKLALDFVRTFPCGKAKYCWLSYDNDNYVVKSLFKSFGFKEVPDAFYKGGEMPAVLSL